MAQSIHNRPMSNNPGATSFGQTAQDTANTGADAAKGMATAVADKASEAACYVSEKAGDAANYVGEKVKGATSAVAGGMKSLGGSIRESLPHDGILGSASGAVADTLESSGKYLQQHGLSGIGEDLTDVIKKNPIPAVLLGVAVGFLIARATRA